MEITRLTPLSVWQCPGSSATHISCKFKDLQILPKPTLQKWKIRATSILIKALLLRRKFASQDRACAEPRKLRQKPAARLWVEEYLQDSSQIWSRCSYPSSGGCSAHDTPRVPLPLTAAMKRRNSSNSTGVRSSLAS